MNDITEKTYYKVNPEVVFTLIDDEAVLMGPSNEELYGTNPVATEIWRLLEEKPMSVAEISQFISEKYGIDKTQSDEDSKTYLQSLLEENFIIRE